MTACEVLCLLLYSLVMDTECRERDIDLLTPERSFYEIYNCINVINDVLTRPLGRENSGDWVLKYL